MFVKHFEDEEHYISPQCTNASFSDMATVSYKNVLMKINTNCKYGLGVCTAVVPQRRG